MNWDAALAIGLKLLAVAALVFLNGFFVAAEFALVKVRETQLDELIRRGSRWAAATRQVVRHLDASLSACQLGITLASLALGWIGEPVFSALLHPVFLLAGLSGPDTQHLRETAAIIVGFTAMTFLHITAGEQAPKWLAIQKPLPVALVVAQPLRLFHFVSYPFIWALNHASLWMLRRAGLQAGGSHEFGHSEDELRLLLSNSTKTTDGTSLGRAIVLNAFDLRRRIAREVMRPRREITVLSTRFSMAECLDLADKTRFSRFPLCEDGDVERTLGVIHIKDLYANRLKITVAADLLPYARKLVFVPETARLEKVLQLLLDRRLHMAFVVDEYGSTSGMVTLENILEELVGQIQDEFDQEQPLIQATGDGEWELDGLLPLHELAELTGEALHAEDVTTVSGFVTQRLGGFPKSGDRLALGPFELRVIETEENRVTRLRLVRTSPPGAATGPFDAHGG
ncbi:MAG: HlyC/CorC family transporter [Verrucomicrobia bacterium]|nr:HlyC/CorC family transporter [Verrucomicrobiota bacterium]